MTLMELDIVGRDSDKQLAGFLQTLIFDREPHDQFDIAWLADQTILPAWIGKVVEAFRFLAFLYLVGVPSAGDENEIIGEPVGAFQIRWISGRLRQRFFPQELLIIELDDVFDGELGDVDDGPAAARLSDDARRELVGSPIDMVDLHAREPFFKLRQNLFRVDLRQGGVKINRATFLDRRVMKLIERLAPRSRSANQSQNE